MEVAQEIPQEIDVEKLMDEDVDEMILETGVDDDAQLCRTSRSQVPSPLQAWSLPEDVSNVTVEVEQPQDQERL